MKHLTVTEDLPVRGAYDVIVAGAGVAGIAAAINAKRAGKSVLLIEKSINMGGLATIGLINLFVPMCNGRGIAICKGMAEELLRMSIRYSYDTLPEHWQNPEGKKETETRYITRYSPQIFALTLAEVLRNEGVTLLLDTVVSRPVMTGNHCDGLILENKTGRSFYEAKQVIDATGDADILYRAGVPTIQGKNYFTYSGKQITLEDCKKAYEKGRIDLASNHALSGGPANLYGGNHPADKPFYPGTTAENVTEFILDNQQVMLDKIKDTDRNTRDIITIPYMPQFRTTRCIDGDYVLQTDDLYKHFDDSVSAICDFDHRDALYEVPYRCLVKRPFDNLITAGRSAAAQGYAWDVLRVIPPAILTGQAAGQAAANAIDENVAIADIDITKLQAQLKDQNVMVHFDDALVPEDRNLETWKEFDHF